MSFIWFLQPPLYSWNIVESGVNNINTTTLVNFTSFAGGAYYDEQLMQGGMYVCHLTSILEKKRSIPRLRVRSWEWFVYFFASSSNNEDVSCVFCRSLRASSVITTPEKNWTLWWMENGKPRLFSLCTLWQPRTIIIHLHWYKSRAHTMVNKFYWINALFGINNIGQWIVINIRWTFQRLIFRNDIAKRLPMLISNTFQSIYRGFISIQEQITSSKYRI